MWARWLAACLLLLVSAGLMAGEQEFAVERIKLVRDIAQLTRASAAETGRPEINPAVLAAMARTPRHRFVPIDQQHYAYHNRPLPIGYGQTISQPFLVALMTDLLEVKPGDRVLELGTGSGYQAALLAEMGMQVYSMEIVGPLATRASQTLAALYPRGVEVRHGDGYYGWEAHAPFDAIIVTAAASHVPPPLVRQLKPGGRMVIPLGASFLIQQLVLVEKAADGRISSREIVPVRFVPLTGEH
ncbi:MAG: protein-L-isoaspartate(D-aspartate) O-methyltransferase [Methylophilaceae bacterium]